MQFVRGKHTKDGALLMSKNEWERLKKLITKKEDERSAVEEIKRLKDERRVSSKAMAETWKTTTLNKRRKELEDRRKLFADIEAKQIETDKRIKLEILERRNKIVEKYRSNKWSERDSTKAVTSATYEMEVLRERSMQLEFNQAEEARVMEENRLRKIEENLNAERYKNERWQQKLKQAETKKIKTTVLLEELKEREDIKRDNDLKLKEEGKVELQRIAKEIEEEKEKEKSKVQLAKEIILTNLKENREIVLKNNEIWRSAEQKENMVLAIFDEAKKKLAKTLKLKEIEILNEKQSLLKKDTEMAYLKQSGAKNISDIAFKNAVVEKERQYQTEQLRVVELAKKKRKDFEDAKAVLDEKNRKEKERLILSHQWELERRLHETKVLCDLKELRKQTKINEMNSFREILNMQCDNNRKASDADREVEKKHYEALIKLWRQHDEEFMTYTKGLIETHKNEGRSVIPLLKAIKVID